MEIKAKIKEFIVNNFLMGEDAGKIQEDTSFLEEAIIDSTGILELVEFIQDTYEFKVEDEELVPDNLDSINNIEKFINSKKQNS